MRRVIICVIMVTSYFIISSGIKFWSKYLNLPYYIYFSLKIAWFITWFIIVLLLYKYRLLPNYKNN